MNNTGSGYLHDFVLLISDT